MKILFLVSSMQGGGAERIAARLCNAWAERGGEVTLMPIAVLRTDSAYMLHKDISLVRLCDIVADSKSKWHRLFALRSFIRKERPDVIVSFLNSVNIATVLSSLGLSIPVIVSERTHPPSYVPPLSHLREKLFRFCYARASAVVAQTGQTKDWLERHIPSAHVVCIPNPVSAELPRNKPVITPESVLASGRRCVFGAGRFDAPKRFNLLIDAFAKVCPNQSDWDLVILGTGELHQELLNQVKCLGLSGRVYLPGFAGNIGDWYERADIFVMPSEFEGFPNVLAEAMANGLPSIAFDIPAGPADITAHGSRAVLLPDLDHVAALSSALNDLMSNTAKRKQLADAAKTVGEEFAEARVLDMWQSLIQSVRSGLQDRTSDTEP